MAKQSDPTYGEIKGKIPVYKNGLDISGEIIVCQEGLIIRADGSSIKVPLHYVKMLEKSGELPLGKVGVEMDVFDQLGQKHYFHFGMSDQHFLFLKKLIPK
ncbi:MAG: hypothetical protein N3F07_03625 [Candidatus Micrarchaeota archaeon]|nr:hypothetical protein [Candidatus Micrarchaeota archaeon]